MIKKNAYFASSNSARGFQSYFDLIYKPSDFKKIFIVKGGPGTGKSSLIKSVGRHFENICDTEYFLCSSDPKSLDGVIINNNIAIIDGTSPHSVEARYPGAIEVIVDSGEGIKKEIVKRREKIIEINEKKSVLYKTAYSYLASAGQIKNEYIKMISENYFEDKLDAAVSRFFRQNIKNGSEYSEKIRLIDGITSSGVICTEGFESRAERNCIIINGYGFETLIYKKLLEKAREYSSKVTISFDPLLPFSINGLFFNEERLSVTSYLPSKHGQIDYDKYKVINSDRFLDKNIISKNKAKIKFSLKCQSALVNEAIDYLKEASGAHSELEEVYKENTDYSFVSKCVSIVTEEVEKLI